MKFWWEDPEAVRRVLIPLPFRDMLLDMVRVNAVGGGEE